MSFVIAQTHVHCKSLTKGLTPWPQAYLTGYDAGGNRSWRRVDEAQPMQFASKAGAEEVAKLIRQTFRSDRGWYVEVQFTPAVSS